jgi:hypothetical protein
LKRDERIENHEIGSDIHPPGVFPLFKRPRSKRVTNETVADDVRSEPGELY